MVGGDAEGEEDLCSVLWIGENRVIRGEDRKESLVRRRNRTDGILFEKERMRANYIHITFISLDLPWKLLTHFPGNIEAVGGSQADCKASQRTTLELITKEPRKLPVPQASTQHPNTGLRDLHEVAPWHTSTSFLLHDSELTENFYYWTKILCPLVFVSDLEQVPLPPFRF